MKKLGLWMLAAILLCGSVVTFVACRGNSLEDIIGNSDNTVPEEVIKELLGALDDDAEIIFNIKYGDTEWNPVLKKEGGNYVLQNVDANPKINSTSSYKLYPTLSYDEETKHIVFLVTETYGITPYIGIIFDVEKNTYAVVNFNATIEFNGITIKGDEKFNKITNALAKKATVVNQGDTENLFYVYYNDGEKWSDIYDRYAEVCSSLPTNSPIKIDDEDVLKIDWDRMNLFNYRLNEASTGTNYVKKGDDVNKTKYYLIYVSAGTR